MSDESATSYLLVINSQLLHGARTATPEGVRMADQQPPFAGDRYQTRESPDVVNPMTAPSVFKTNGGVNSA
jgi:hypothetical protein